MYKLSHILGGRTEVISTPFVDCLGYLIQEFEREEKEAEYKKQDVLIEHISRMLARRDDKEAAKANKEFMNSLQPKENKKAEPFKLEWETDEAKLKRLTAT